MTLSECYAHCHEKAWSESAIETLRRAVCLAEEQDSICLGTEHLLHALVAGENNAVALITQHDESSVEKILQQLERLQPSAGLPQPPTGDILVSPQTVKVILTTSKLAVAETAAANKQASCEHILIAMLIEVETVAHQVLLNIGFSYNRMIKIVGEILDSDSESNDEQT